ncbi:PAS domain-containing protein [Vibrio sp. LaRot3]|uniref:PAS domain-containing protein n=1 Tax=Vibrio sp. LaRot3 TaxID=2998829 RepID=UPI0022CDD2C5|nr:PAS domain-containing protein [Vibrio sp. LaRot3]MDA0148181.1 PAS domain-containing protein [Vibrio sp. LaRot3]
MKIRSSLDVTIRWVIYSVAVVVAFVAGATALTALNGEREYWKNQIAENYKYQVLGLVKDEFFKINKQSEFLRTSNTVYSYTKYRNLYGLSRVIESRHLEQFGITGVLVQDVGGREVYSNSKTANHLFKSMVDMFVPVMDSPYEMARDHGFIFVDGRIFLYSSYELLGVNRDGSAGQLTMFKEVTSQHVAEISQKLGRKFDIQYTSASRRLMRVSYSSGVEISVHDIAATARDIKIEYRAILPSGVVQPASFVVYFPLEKQISDHWIVAVSVCLFIFATILVAWVMIRQFVMIPASKVAEMITDESGFKNQELTNLPTELDEIYQRFRHLYDNIERQNRFSEQLVDAIGDVIITVNIDGEIEYLNPAACEWLGFEEKKLLGEPIEMYITTRDKQHETFSSWLYKTNMMGHRVERTLRLNVLGRKNVCYSCDIICQPVDLNRAGGSESTSVVVIRINSTKRCNRGMKACKLCE